MRREFQDTRIQLPCWSRGGGILMERIKWVLVLFVVGCGQPPTSDAGEEGAEEATWGSCFGKDLATTCAEICELEGLVCVEAGCPAEPQFCEPDSCDMATRVMGIGDQICEDVSGGGFYADGCNAPIDWLFSNTVRCCCA